MEQHVDWVPIVVPTKVFEIPPTPTFAEPVPFPEAEGHRSSYLDAVHAATGEWSLPEREEVVEFLMRLFTAENYTGQLCSEERKVVNPVLTHLAALPPVPQKDAEDVGKGAADEHDARCKEWDAAARRRDRDLRLLLQVDGEVVVPCMSLPAVLLASRGIVKGLPPSNLWRLRVLYRHHGCLLRSAHSLFDDIAGSVDAMRDTQDVATLIELSFVQITFNQEHLAADSAFKAMQLSGLQLSEEVMEGVRTRWQTNKHYQSVVVAQSTSPAVPLPDAERQRTMPAQVQGFKDGHDLYDRPRTSTDVEGDGLPAAEGGLCPVDHAIILALCHTITNSNPQFGLTTHQIQTYVERLIIDHADPVYALRNMALLVRSRLEQRRSRVQQRAYLQMESLLHAIETKRNPDQPTWYRADPRYVYSVHLPTHWGLQKEFAAECVELTLYKTALQLYEEVEDWDNIILCCTKLDRRRKAETLAREKIDEDPTNPLLWVALGEASRDETHLWKAWELSGKRMAAPMRSLARLALQREQWTKVLEYFDMAVAINPVFGGDWFSLGYAAMKLNDMEKAASAFTRVCQMDPENAYGWTNLGNIYVRMNKYRPALSAMSQALRQDRKNWRMWGNYWSVAVQLLEVTEATHALHTAVELAGREFVFDDQVLIDFTSIVLRYLRGAIGPTDNVPNEDEQALTHQPLAGEDDPQQRRADPDEGEDEEMALEPLFVDSDDEEDAATTSTPAASAVTQQRRDDSEKAATRAREAFRGRVCRVFDSVVSHFPDLPVVYRCAASLYGEVEGPAGELRFRLKEFRERMNQPHWARSSDKFAETFGTLVGLCDAARAVGTAESKRQALDVLDTAIHAATDHLEHDPLFEQAQQLRLEASRWSTTN